MNINDKVVYYLNESYNNLSSNVENFEKDTKFNLPEDFKQYVKTNKKLPSKNVNFITFKKYNWGNNVNYDALEWEGLPKGAVIFAQDLGGDIYCFYKGQIYHITHDPLKITKFSNTFTEFLKKIK
jgi:hypothetical protein